MDSTDATLTAHVLRLMREAGYVVTLTGNTADATHEGKAFTASSETPYGAVCLLAQVCGFDLE